jgi:hypothetical protein
MENASAALTLVANTVKTRVSRFKSLIILNHVAAVNSKTMTYLMVFAILAAIIAGIYYYRGVIQAEIDKIIANRQPQAEIDSIIGSNPEP